MKILQIIPALGAGGAEQAVVDINAALVAAGHDSFVVSSGGPRVSAIEAAGGTHITLDAASKNPLQIIANSGALAQIVGDHHIDIIHARSRAPAWSAWLAARRTKCHYITTFHAAYKYSNPFKKLYNSVMARGERVIAISDFIAQHVVSNYAVPPEQVTTIYRGIDLTHFDRAAVTPERLTALRTLWKLKPGQRVVLLPARLSRIKGQDVLIEAMRRLLDQDGPADVVAVIIGAAQGRSLYVKELWEQIISGRLRDNVVLAEHCDDMPAAYALADVVVVPSLVPEGFGRVPVEAQAMGVPVIATDLGATRETVLPEVTGWLVPPDNPAILAEHLQRVLQLLPAERQQIAVRAAEVTRAKFALPVMTRATLAVYQAVLAAGQDATAPAAVAETADV